jgi:hypothetical protein
MINGTASTWSGVGAPKAMAAEIVEKLNKEINAALADHKIKARLADLGSTPLAGSATELVRVKLYVYGSLSQAYRYMAYAKETADENSRAREFSSQLTHRLEERLAWPTLAG